MRLLGVDFGFKRIGVAVVDEAHGFPAPRPVVAASGKLKSDAKTISELGKKEGAHAIVLGLPLEPDGAAGRMARICRQLASHIEALGYSVFLVDERLTSLEAEQGMLDEDLRASQRDKRRDAEAACLILERYIARAKSPIDSDDSRENPSPPGRKLSDPSPTDSWRGGEGSGFGGEADSCCSDARAVDGASPSPPAPSSSTGHMHPGARGGES